MQPWHHRWATHRETEQVKAYYKVQKYLGYANVEGVDLMDSYSYKKSTDYKEQKETKEQEHHQHRYFQLPGRLLKQLSPSLLTTTRTMTLFPLHH